MITGCPDCPHQGDGNSQAGLQAHINRVPGPTATAPGPSTADVEGIVRSLMAMSALTGQDARAVVDAALALAADRPSVTDNARAEEQSGYTVQQTAAHFARSVQRVSDRIQRTDYRRSVVDVVALESVQGFLDRIARDDLGVYAAGRTETTTATVEDAVEVAYRMAYDVMRYHPGIWHNSLRAAVEALADAGLLATARVKPSREALVAAIGHEDQWCSLSQSEPATDGSCCDAGHLADAALALWPGRTEAEVKAEALEEAAAAWAEDPDQIGDSEADARNWLRDRADTLRAGGRRG